MPVFDAICHAFATMATGGFSTRNASVGAFASPAIDWIIIVFMLLAGTNFTLHYLALTGKWRVYLRDEEFRFYIAVAAAATVLVTAPLVWLRFYPAWPTALRHGVFQTVSIMTTTGFSTADYSLWPPVAHSVLLILMSVGGCAGSTGGGIKVMRVLLLLKQAKVEMRSCCTRARSPPSGSTTAPSRRRWRRTYWASSCSSCLSTSVASWR